MLILSELKWAGRAWPAAEIVGGTSEGFVFETTGKGRPVDLIGPSAWWRNFSEINLDDPAAVVGFVRRRGDPFGQLSPTTQGDTSGWAYVSSLLKLAASCWTRAAPSRCTVWDNGYVMEALLASPLFVESVAFAPHVRKVGKDSRSGPSTARRGLTISIRPENLAGYMMASAILHLESHAEMAVCEQCGDWFELDRRDAKFCSASCRAASAISKKGKSDGER